MEILWKGIEQTVLYVGKWAPLAEICALRVLSGTIFLAFFQEKYYPVNLLRNIALNMVTTEFVFLSDVDFIPSMLIYQAIKQHLHHLNESNSGQVVSLFWLTLVAEMHLE